MINPHIGRHSDEHEYLKVAAEWLVILGAFHLVFSIIGMSVIVFSSTISLAGETSLLSMLDFLGFYIVQMILYGFVLLQIFLGWAVGLLTIKAGRDCLHTHSWHFVFRVIVLNWFFFPIGTVMGFFIWREFRHKGIRRFFDDV